MKYQGNKLLARTVGAFESKGIQIWFGSTHTHSLGCIYCSVAVIHCGD